jgi:chromosome segregation ATPase
MDFSLEHLEIVPTEKTAGANSTHSTSSVLDDLSSQIEELQNKLKLNYRKLLLFETENQKLIQEKNKFYFDAKNHQEKNEILIQKNSKLENFNHEIESKYKQASEKYQAFEKLCQTQTVDLKRLTKFHLKIQNIVKPYVQGLKSQISELETNLNQSRLMGESFEKLNNENILQVQYLKDNLDFQKNKFESEKTNFIQSYEEQIHFLSKEILDYQQKNDLLQSEVFKYKKMNENKNFIENELIRFKRTQESDQNQMSDLKIKNTQFENQISMLSSENSDLKTKLITLEKEQSQVQQNLDVTRSQLNTKINELEKLHLRLKMLEKLNTHLSLSFTNPSVEVPLSEL